MFLMRKPMVYIPERERAFNLDVIRAISAQLVLVSHAFALLIVPFGTPIAKLVADEHPISRFLWKGLGFFSGRGMDAVMAFFLLSGLLVGASTAQAFQTGRFKFFDYWVRRSVRMYSVVVPGLLLGALLLWIAYHLSDPVALIRARVPWYPEDWPIAQSESVQTLGCNLLFLQTIACHQFGHNSSLWSLSNEYLYYLVFPMLLIVASSVRQKQLSPATIFSLLGVFFIFLLWFIAPKGEPRTTSLYFSGFLIWLLGAALGRWKIENKFDQLSFKAKTLAVSAVVILSVALYFSGGSVSKMFGVVLLTALTISLRSIIQNWVSFAPRAARLVASLSDCSFSLYVIHLPIVFFVASLASLWLPSLTKSSGGFFVFCGGLIAINIIAYVFYLAFERHHSFLYQRLMALRK
jgi:peptidoglycan/LPS O-acetylase OafA/YrhL